MDSYTIKIDGEVLANLVRDGYLRPSEFQLLEITFKDDDEDTDTRI